MTKEELLAEFDALMVKVVDFARKSVTTPPSNDGNPSVTLAQGEESVAGHVNAQLAAAKEQASTMVGESAPVPAA